MSGVPAISEYYAGKCLFITGATGFMGKVLVEKLLRSCPDIQCMYLLIRPKRGKEPQERLDEIVDSRLFDKVKEQHPDFKCKLRAVEGDMVKTGLGLDQAQLFDKVKEQHPDFKCKLRAVEGDMVKTGLGLDQAQVSMLAQELFDKVKEQHPDFKCKLRAVEGDMVKTGLGLDQAQVSMLAQEVQIVFHSAATIKFDEEMKLAVEMNIVGVRSIIELCQKLPKLESFVHISTAYCNCDRDVINEEIYPPPLQPQQLLSALEWMDKETMNKLTPKMIGDRPNTYTYTKAIAESLIVEMGSNLPVAIFRPSIVGATLLEPVPGWVDNVNGPTGIFTAMGKGVLRIMKGDHQATADIIPADLATNMLIAVGWYTGVTKPKEIKVYHCTTGQMNNVKWGQIKKFSFEFMMKNPVENMARIPRAKLTNNAIWHDLNVAFDHTLPAYLMDFYMWISGRRRMFVRIQERLRKAVGSLDFFTSRSWTFTSDNMIMLENALSTADRKIFPFNPRCFNWSNYIESFCLGTKQFVLKEDLAKLPEARKALRRMQKMSFMFNAVAFVVIWRLLVKRFAVARILWNMILGWASKLLQKLPGFAKSS